MEIQENFSNIFNCMEYRVRLIPTPLISACRLGKKNYGIATIAGLRLATGVVWLRKRGHN